MPGIMLTEDEMNNSLHVSIPPELNNLRIGNPLSLVLENNSQELIVLPQDYGIRIFQLVVDDWEPVENRMEYSSSRKAVNPNNDLDQLVFVTVYPYIISDQKVDIRFVIEGNYSIDETGKLGDEVGAYIDVTLEPK